MLCTVCTSMFSRHLLKGPHHRTFGDVQRAVDADCLICASLARQFSSQAVTNPKCKLHLVYKFTFHYKIKIHCLTNVIETAYIHLRLQQEGAEEELAQISPTTLTSPHELKVWWSNYFTVTRPYGPNTTNLIPRRRVDEEFTKEFPEDTGHPDVAQLGRIWLNNCLENHPNCRVAECENKDKDWYPDRVLDITGEQPRLLVTELHSPRGPVYSSGNTTQDVSGRYLDNKKTRNSDWQKQGAAMKSVYSNCILNISAVRAQNAESGMFVSRNTALMQSCYVRWKNFGRQERLISVTVEEDFHRGLFATPISSPAWVLQERILAPRVLHFGSTQLFWECQNLPDGCEMSPAGFGVGPHPKPPTVKPPFCLEPWNSRGNWVGIVTHYTQLHLTRPDEDIFVALAGIAEREAKSRGRYIAGFFRDRFLDSLLWNIGLIYLPNWTTTRYKGAKYRAPTWSWASMVGFTRVHDGYGRRSNDVELAKFVNFNVSLVDENAPFGQLRAAELALEANVVQAEMLQREKSGSHAIFKMGRAGEALGRFDDLRDMPGKGIDVWLMIVKGGIVDDFSQGERRGLRGLILQRKAIDGIYNYERVGIWRAYIKPESCELSVIQERKTITLI
ncbi:hypothetical protein G7Y89_g5570 [Cudoniella acicularis]|uniref:Heterokaryon incompatibility domain-containing protein n=1 Tax=Cudoniella acicularis TaxID=354080 RepID=A0A8H4RPE0_9HELO|nr:hypothetical protein G7Y89_g5570 [Cudoniella acicularis]